MASLWNVRWSVCAAVLLLSGCSRAKTAYVTPPPPPPAPIVVSNGEQPPPPAVPAEAGQRQYASGGSATGNPFGAEQGEPPGARMAREENAEALRRRELLRQNLLVHDLVRQEQSAKMASSGAAYVQVARVPGRSAVSSKTRVTTPAVFAGGAGNVDVNLEAEIAKLRQGNLAYAPPPSMKMGETKTITARIASKAVSMDTLKAGLAGPGQTVDVVATPVSTKMKMTLTSSDFDIKALSSEEQFVDDRTPTEWSWDMQPKHPGKLGLHLAAVVEVGSLAKDYATVDREIKVEVNPVGALEGFFNANWQKALYAILAALAGAFWKWWGNRKKKVAV